MDFIIQENEGVLDIVLGTMFSGKTSFLLSQIAKMAELNYKILYINIEFDNRSDNFFSTHNPFFDNHVDFIKKESIKSNVIMCKSRTLNNLDIKPYDIVIVDEAHFFDDLIDFTNKTLESKKYIIVAGLQADFKGHKFGKIIDLIPISTNVKRLHAYCSECAKTKKCRIAIYSKRITKSKKINDIGGSDKYIPVCREHFHDIQTELPIQPPLTEVLTSSVANSQNVKLDQVEQIIDKIIDKPLDKFTKSNDKKNKKSTSESSSDEAKIKIKIVEEDNKNLVLHG